MKKHHDKIDELRNHLREQTSKVQSRSKIYLIRNTLLGILVGRVVFNAVVNGVAYKAYKDIAESSEVYPETRLKAARTRDAAWSNLKSPWMGLPFSAFYPLVHTYIPNPQK